MKNTSQLLLAAPILPFRRIELELLVDTESQSAPLLDEAIAGSDADLEKPSRLLLMLCRPLDASTSHPTFKRSLSVDTATSCRRPISFGWYAFPNGASTSE
jgi:hypothetical protein